MLSAESFWTVSLRSAPEGESITRILAAAIAAVDPGSDAWTLVEQRQCGLCVERRAEGKNPICVDACPMRAMDAGPLEEMRAKHGKAKKASGFTYDEKLKPSIVYKPKLEK